MRGFFLLFNIKTTPQYNPPISETAPHKGCRARPLPQIVPSTSGIWSVSTNTLKAPQRQKIRSEGLRSKRYILLDIFPHPVAYHHNNTSKLVYNRSVSETQRFINGTILFSIEYKLQFFIYNIELESHRDRFTVYLHGDDHYGSNTTDEKAILRFRDDVLENGKDKNTRVLLMGDYCYSFPKNDIRREEGDYTKPDPLMLYTEFRDIIKPIAHKVDCALIGNHDRDWVKAENTNFVHWMCAELKIPYGDYESFVRYKVKVKGAKAKRNVDFVIWHGDGGGRTSGSSFNKVHNPVDVYRTPDVLAMGHVHRLGWSHEQYLQPNEKHMDMEDVDQYFVLTGGYQKGFVAPKSTYISRKMLPPVAIGAVKLNIQPFHSLDDTRDVLDISFEEVR